MATTVTIKAPGSGVSSGDLVTLFDGLCAGVNFTVKSIQKLTKTQALYQSTNLNTTRWGVCLSSSNDCILYHTGSPTTSPTSAPTGGPTTAPTPAPTGGPTTAPTNAPTGSPTSAPTGAPTAGPTPAPTGAPTSSPTSAPTAGPTPAPTAGPTAAPTTAPTPGPTYASNLFILNTPAPTTP